MEDMLHCERLVETRHSVEHALINDPVQYTRCWTTVAYWTRYLSHMEDMLHCERLLETRHSSTQCRTCSDQ